jgi:co-chaperonin GroES (HSP10)
MDKEAEMETETGMELEKINIEMMPNRVLVKVSERISKGGLLLPDNVKKKLGEGIVMKAGPPNIEVRNSPKIEGGERIVYYKGGGDPVKIGVEEYIVIQIMDIYFVLYRGEIPDMYFAGEESNEIPCSNQE